LAALALAVIGVATAGLLAGGGSGTPARSSTTPALASIGTRHRATTKRAHASTGSKTASAEAASAQQLQASGHREMLDGNYQTAIPTLRQAVSSSDPGSLTYAYALYDLGRSLVLGGDPTGAIPVLRQRLKIPNQTPLVKQLLDQALRATGQEPPTPTIQAPPTATTPTTTTPVAPAPKHGPGHAPGQGPFHTRPNGGAGLSPPSPEHGHGHGQGQGQGQGRGHASEHFAPAL
ncbi:MAG: tetratricopeptide repeat protein, partial [Solirubrobacteraceae bacterium]